MLLLTLFYPAAFLDSQIIAFHGRTGAMHSPGRAVRVEVSQVLTAGLLPRWQAEETAAREEVLGQSEHRLQTLKLSFGTQKKQGRGEGKVLFTTS